MYVFADEGSMQFQWSMWQVYCGDFIWLKSPQRVTPDSAWRKNFLHVIL